MVELYVRKLSDALAFYRRLGFTVIREEAHFAELQWETSMLFLEEVEGQPEPPREPAANIRIMVADVDRYWAICTGLGLRVLRPVGDRYYGLRDFTVISPEGVGLRFASPLT